MHLQVVLFQEFEQMVESLRRRYMPVDRMACIWDSLRHTPHSRGIERSPIRRRPLAAIATAERDIKLSVNHAHRASEGGCGSEYDGRCEDLANSVGGAGLEKFSEDDWVKGGVAEEGELDGNCGRVYPEGVVEDAESDWVGFARDSRV